MYQGPVRVRLRAQPGTAAVAAAAKEWGTPAGIVVGGPIRDSRKIQGSEGARRSVCGDWIEPYHQRRKFLLAEIRARRSRDERHRSPPHRGSADAAGRVERANRRIG